MVTSYGAGTRASLQAGQGSQGTCFGAPGLTRAYALVSSWYRCKPRSSVRTLHFQRQAASQQQGGIVLSRGSQTPSRRLQ